MAEVLYYILNIIIIMCACFTYKMSSKQQVIIAKL